MHLLQAKAGAAVDETEAVDLGQTPGDIVFLSAADTELASLAAARGAFDDAFPSLRLANLMHLAHPMSVDTYVESVVSKAKLVVARVLGGSGYWPYGVEQLVEACGTAAIPLALLPGDDQPDPEFVSLGSVSAETTHRLWQYCVHAGPANSRHLLAFAADLIGCPREWREPAPLPRAGVYRPGAGMCGFDELASKWIAGAPVAAIVFYRAHLQAANLAPVDALARALRARGVNALPLYVSSLKDPVSADLVGRMLDEAEANLVLNTTGFAVATPGAERRTSPFDACGRPVLQVVLAGGDEESWAGGMQGLSARDIAMNVALPEVDGRILARAVSFKAEARFDARTECPIVAYAPRPDRIDFTADLARAWIALAATPACERRIGIVLANYPNRDGRLGNGVGLDTPAGTLELLRAMAAAGYAVAGIPADGNALIAVLAAGPTNAGTAGREIRERLPRDDYLAFFAALPPEVRDAVGERWGAPERDPLFVEAADGTPGFALPAIRFGNVTVGIQPARGYHIDPSATYHDSALVPPHGYLAFYAWLRARVHAVVHMGKHGNLEWLPGKALALSAACYPEAALGALPHVYPFIVNDPGEGTQAKRRAQAVIVDHLTPPLTRAESYGPLSDLERLVDEYYEASGVDPRRLRVLRDDILELVARLGLDRDCGIAAGEDAGEALTKLDAYLCELKEMQIRDGLHVFGRSPHGDQLHDLLVALVRLPRGEDRGASASLLRALARDLGLDGFRPPGLRPRRALDRPAASRRSKTCTICRQQRGGAPGTRWNASKPLRARWSAEIAAAPSSGPGPRRSSPKWTSGSGPRSSTAEKPRSGASSLPSTGASSSPALPAPRLAGAPRCCRRAATSTPSTRVPSPPRSPGASAGSRPLCSSSATGRSTGSGRAAWRSPRGAPRTCAPAATTSPRPLRSWGRGRSGSRAPGGSRDSRSCPSISWTGPAST